MIFLCSNCQAKYQLPDERVAGKTVRMKCRKCEHLIEVQGPKGDTEPSERAPSEGWYAGIDGTPTGPMSAEELAKKVEAGAITRESLVWREGLDEWKPFRSFPELAELTAEAPAPPEPMPAEIPVERPSRVDPPAPLSRPSVTGIPRPPVSRVSVPRVSSSRISAAPKLEEITATSQPEPAASPKVAPSTLSLVSDADPKPESKATSELAPQPEPAAAPKPEPKPESIAGLALALDASPTYEPSPALDRAQSLVMPIAPKRAGMHPAAWALLGGLGGVLIGIFVGLSLAEKPKPEVQVVTVTVPAPPPPAPVESAEVAEPEAPQPAEAEKAPAPAEPQKVAAAPAKPKAPTTTSTSTPAGGAGPAMTGLSGLSGFAAGPSAGPTKSGSAGGGGALSQAEVERVVQSHRAFVKRRCWELALATKSQGAPTSARVATAISIAPDGRVTNASATGGEGYPGLASCVAGQVRGWKFPPSEGGTVNVPFVFAAQ